MKQRLRAETLIDGAVAVIAVAAVYVYFLIFAQFGFLHLLEARLSAAAWRPAMGAMGLAGLGASLATGALYRRLAPTAWIRLGFVGCAVSASAALFSGSVPAFLAVAAGVGASTGVLTVSLACGLRQLLPLHRLGLGAGLGTGAAYGICNLPALFAGSPTVKVAAAVVACGVGFAALGLVSRVTDSEEERKEERDHRALGPSAFSGLGFAAILVSFSALIWLDSAAFLIIQETASWKAHTWGDAGRQLALGACHAGAAVFAGWWIDRGGFRSLLLGAWGLFALAFTVLQGSPSWVDATGPVYVLGISFYSTALVAFPGLGAEKRGRLPRSWRAAWIFGIAGWVGSALGVGMAQDLHDVPDAFLVGTGLALAAATLFGRIENFPWQKARPASAGALALPMVALAAGLLLPVLSDGSPTRPEVEAADVPAARSETSSDAAARGRRVYIREGCIHCHSQYVRPEGDDVERYGPHRPVDRDDRPVLIGNRRQGPDLTWAGSRRDAAWLERHLRDPRGVVPGSRMPAYDHLFEGPAGRTDGDDLVAYLASKRPDGGPRP